VRHSLEGEAISKKPTGEVKGGHEEVLGSSLQKKENVVSSQGACPDEEKKVVKAGRKKGCYELEEAEPTLEASTG